MTTRHEPITSYTVKVKLKSALGRGKTVRRYRLNSIPTRVKGRLYALSQRPGRWPTSKGCASSAYSCREGSDSREGGNGRDIL
eukprot:scaffold111599_cov33-Phaeocystis_antarctica.AAC.1